MPLGSMPGGIPFEASSGNGRAAQSLASDRGNDAGPTGNVAARCSGAAWRGDWLSNLTDGERVTD